MLEKSIITYAALTLSKQKSASLFTQNIDEIDIEKEIRNSNKILNPKNVYITILKKDNNRALIYVYRKDLVFNDLNKKDAKAYLTKLGYDTTEIKKCIEKLKNRVSFKIFPHEIGFFLGYPCEDVLGFIENKGCNFKYCGYWKVYGNCNACIQKFNRFNKIRRSYEILHLRGKSLERLCIA
ncbi:MAG: DUF3793 family protein [Tissierellia bacterium]|nr:DUF3793 family protein [Tissierellia bacterium]